MKINSAIDRAHQHRLCADRRIVKRELALRVGLGVEDRLHSALQLDEDYLDTRGRLTGGAIFHRSVNGGAENRRERR